MTGSKKWMKQKYGVLIKWKVLIVRGKRFQSWEYRVSYLCTLVYCFWWMYVPTISDWILTLTVLFNCYNVDMYSRSEYNYHTSPTLTDGNTPNFGIKIEKYLYQYLSQYFDEIKSSWKFRYFDEIKRSLWDLFSIIAARKFEFILALDNCTTLFAIVARRLGTVDK